MREGFAQGVVQLRRIGHANALEPAQGGEVGEVRVVQGRLPDVPIAGTLLLADLAQLAVVEHHVREVGTVLDHGGQLREVLPEPAVAADRNDLAAGKPRIVLLGRSPGAERSWQREADRAQVARHQHRLSRTLEVAPEGIRVVTDIDRNDRVLGNLAGHRGEHGCRVHAGTARLGLAPFLLLTPDPPALGDLGSLVHRLDVVAQPLDEQPRGRTDLTPHRTIDAVEPSQRHRVVVDLDRRLLRRDTGVVRKARAHHQQRVTFVHEPTGDRRTATPEHAATERVRVRDQTLALERGEHRSVQLLGEPCYRGHVETGAVADDDHRALGGFQHPRRLIERRLRRGDLARRHTTFGRAGFRRGRRLDILDLVGEDQVRHAAIQHRAFDCKVNQFGVAAGVQDGLTPLRDLAERGLQIDFLERTGAEHLSVDLTGQREHRRTIDVGVPQPCQQVGRARAGDGETRGGAPGEFAVGRGGECRRALVADTDESQLAVAFLPAQCVGQAEVRVPDHAEGPTHAPVRHRLGHHVGDRRYVRGFLGETDVHAVVAHLYRERLHAVVVRARRPPRRRVKIPAVPWATQPAVLDRALTERSLLMRTRVVQRGDLALVVRHAHGRAPAGDRFDTAVRQLVEIERFFPDVLTVFRFSHPRRLLGAV